MIEKIKTKKEVIEYLKYCDVCGAELTHRLACTNAKCMYCKRDLCEECIGHEEGTGGDYRDVWCNQCWNIGVPYRPKIKEWDEEIERLSGEWQRKCKEGVKNKV